MLFEFIIVMIVAFMLIVFGVLIWKKGKIELIHSYHYKNVKAEDIKAYTSLMGKALLVLGAGIFIKGIIDYITKAHWGWAVFGVGFVISFFMINKAQKKYNGSWFS